MASLLCHLHFWTMKALSPGTASGESVVEENKQLSTLPSAIYSVFSMSQGSDIGAHVYHEKTAAGVEGGIHICRKEWAQCKRI